MIDLNSEACVGCGVCTIVCPKQCLKLSENEVGELRPVIIKNTCINCGLCERKCIAEMDVNPEFNILRSYYGYAKDRTVQDQSSSGGIFYAIAKSFIQAGGVVCGASFDEDGMVKHILIDKCGDLYRLQGSKYCETDLPDVLPEIEKLLKKGDKVLFSGVPCNVAALKKYLGDQYNALYTCEIFCHGAPRRGVYRRYLEMLEHKYGQISDFNFRAKEKGWSHPGYRFKTDGGMIYQSHSKNIYHLMFGMHHSLRRSCLNCKFRLAKRNADISLGDFWGIDKFYPNVYRKEHGINAVLVNTEKGLYLLNQSDVKLFDCQADEIFYANKWQISNFKFPDGYDQYNEDYVKCKNRLFFMKYQVIYLLFNRIKRMLLKNEQKGDK